jgi:DNA-binding transcriptional LysR family regulator
VRPAYEALRTGVERAHDAAHGRRAVLRLGFQDAVDGSLATALHHFEQACPDQSVELTELPLSEPFTALRRRDVDAAIVLLPMCEDDLELGPAFSREPHALAVPAHHPFADRPTVDAEDLAACTLIDLAGAAPDYWRRAQTPRQTPAGRPIATGTGVTTLQEGLSLVAAGRGAMLMCRATAEQHAGRRSLAFVPVAGLPPSRLGLVWPRGLAPPAIHALGRALLENDR